MARAAHPPAERNLTSAAIIVTLLLLIAAVLAYSGTPKPVSKDGPPSGFSALRALQHVTVIARTPHPIGTAENTEVRNYLVEQLQRMGFTPEVQSGLLVAPDWNRIAIPHNILLRIPGQKQSGKALMLAAHYDSAYPSPGAADNAASVGAILETLRALNYGSPLENDLIILLSDGEEAGLLGAKLFAQQHRWAKDIGLVLNFEYRGNTGPVWMFETSAGNTELVKEWSRAAPRPLGNSLLFEVYKRMPNTTDASVFREAGVPLLNFAAGEGYTAYHTELDRTEALDPSTLQHQGDIMLALVRHFGSLPLNDLRGSDSVYFNVPGYGVVQYSGTWAWIFGAGSLALAVVACRLAVRSGQAKLLALSGAIPAFLLTAVAVVAASQLMWQLVTLLHPQYSLLLHGSPYNAIWYLPASVALSIAVFTLIHRLLQRWFKPVELAGGALLTTTVLGLAANLWLPGASFVFLWPAAPVLAAIAFLATRRGRVLSDQLRLILLLAASVPALCLLIPAIHFTYFALTPSMIAVTAAIVALLLGTLGLFLHAFGPSYRLAAVALITTVACLCGGALTADFNEQRPRPSNLSYVQDELSGQGHWISRDEHLNRWTRQFFEPQPDKGALKALYGERAALNWMRHSSPLVGPSPSITVLKDATVNGEHMLTLEVRSLRKAPQLSVHVNRVAVKRASVAGHPFGKPNARGWHVEAYGLLGQALQIELVLPADKPFRVIADDVSYGLPAHPHGPRPHDLINQPFGDSETTRLISAVTFER